MSSVAARPSPLARVRARPLGLRAGLLLLGGLTAFSLLLRTRALLAGFWIDEGLSVGIASYGLLEIPGVLRLDGSPPLYYMLLHVWMEVVGDGEGRTHALSVAFAVLTVPAAFWGARSLAGLRAGWMAAIVAAIHPFLTFYAQETRMYALVALLSLIAATAFTRGFAFRERRWVAAFAATGVALLYTHNWALFLLAGSVVALIPCWRALAGDAERRALARDAALAYGAMGVLYLPWVPTLISQAAQTGAPWAERPGVGQLVSSFLATLGGGGGAPLLLVVAGAGLAALLGRAVPLPAAPAAAPAGEQSDRRRLAAETVLTFLFAALLIAWVASLLSPAWANRYLAVLVGPVLLLSGIGLAYARGLGVAALVVLALLWADGREGALNGKSNAREVAARIAFRPVGPGDVVVSTHPEQVPLLRYYLGDEFRYADPLGPVRDPRVFDWRNALERLRESRPTPTAHALVDGMRPGQALILVQPLLRPYHWTAPWTEVVRRRTVQWERVLNREPRLRRVETFPKYGLRRPPRGVRATVYRVR